MQNVKLNLDKVLENKGKSIYWLAKKTGSAYSTLHRMATNSEVKTVDLDVLQAICDQLNCEITDIIPIKPKL